jgi:thiol-disulfide isomerase/thioredoxin
MMDRSSNADLVSMAATTIPVPPPVLEVYYASSCEPCRLELPVLAEAARGDGVHLVVVILDEETRARHDLAAAAPALDAAAILPSPAGDQRRILREAGDPDGILPYARARQADGGSCSSWRGILTLARIKS